MEQLTKKRKNRIRFKKVVVILISIGFFFTGGLILWASTLNIPDLKSFQQRKIEQSTKIFDRTGEVLLFDLHKNIQRTVIPFEKISRNAKNASVAIEDAEFYQHHGIKPEAIVRATLVNLFSLGFEQGGSTITQQVVKNSILTQKKSIARKIKEWVLSLKLERQMTKEQILELYLNEVPYGGSIYGIEEASREFFGKSAENLTLAQAAYLAALPQAPTYYSPYGNHLDNLEARKNLVLSRMQLNGFITDQEYELAKAETVKFLPRRDTGILAPHFVFFIQEQLEQRFGERALEEQGLRVITTLDWELQKKAEEIVKKFALENEEKFNAENAGLVAIDPKTGQILVMVGSRDYFDENIDGNFNIALAKRQPGSAFKPFVYAQALRKGYTTETVVFDVKTQFSTFCDPSDLSNKDRCYAPGNYDHVFRGPVTFREALAQSINVPSVKVLYLAGLSDSLRLAKDMGITTLTDISRYGLTLVLGGGEVSLLDITSAYGVFANDGVRNPYASILRIEDSKGNVIEEFNQQPVNVLEEQVAWKISDILSDNEARAPSFGTRSPLYFEGRNVAAKTGTTNDFRDAWIIGYTPSIAVGAWAGNNDNSPMEKRVAGFTVAPLWHAFMEEALKKLPEESFPEPNLASDKSLKPVLRNIWRGGESFFIDQISRKLATDYTPAETREEVIIPNIHSILFWLDKNNPRGEKLESPEQDSQFIRWESAIERWKSTNGITQKEITIPTQQDNIHTLKLSPKLSIITPTENQTVSASQRVSVSITAKPTRFSLQKVDFFLNNVFIGSTKQPFTFTFIPENIDAPHGNNTLRVVLYDSVFNKTENRVTFFVR